MRTSFLLLVFVFVASTTLPATAQSPWQNQLAVTGGAQVPTSSFEAGWKTGVGLSATYYSRLGSHFFFGLRGGYHQFQAKTGDETLNVIPLQVATKVNITVTGVQPYLGVDGGLYLIQPDEGDDNSEFGVAPKVGFRIPIASGVDLDLNATYEVILNDSDNSTYLGLNAGLAYTFGPMV